MTKSIYTILLATCLALRLLGQSPPTYYHDSTLDAIQNNVGFVDGAVNNLTNSLLTSNNLIAGGETVAASFNNGGTNNDMSQVTNFANYFASELTNVLSNSPLSLSGLFATNILAVNTNFFPDGQVSNNSGYTIPLSYSGGAVSQSFNMMALSSTSAFSTLAPEAAEIVLLIMSFYYFVEIVRYLQNRFLGTLNQKQLKGNKQELFGANVDFLSGVGFAIFISAVIIALMSYILGSTYLVTTGQSASLFPSTLKSLENNQSTQVNSAFAGLWATVTMLLPIGGMLVSFFNFVIFRYFLVYPFFLTVRGFIFCFID